MPWDPGFLRLEPPRTVYSFRDLGAEEGRGALSPVAITSPFRILSEEGVAVLQAICAELRHRARPTTWTATQSVGAVYRSEFLRGLSRDPALAAFLGELARAPLEPHPIAHHAIVVNYPPNEPSRELSPWHRDAVSFDYVLMVSDPRPMRGGRFEYFAGSLEEARRLLRAGDEIPRDRVRAVEFPGAGWAVLQQGHRVIHRVSRLLRPYERTTVVGAYWTAHPELADPVGLDHLRKAHGDEIALREWGLYVAALIGHRLQHARAGTDGFSRPLAAARAALEAALAGRKKRPRRPSSIEGNDQTKGHGMSHEERTDVEAHGSINVNESVVEDDPDVEGHGGLNVNESVVEDDADVEGHSLLSNVNEALVEDDAEVEGHGTTLQANETVLEDADVEAHGSLNVNESVVEDDAEVEGHGILDNVNESVVEDDGPEVEGHGMLSNVNEALVDDDDAEVEAHGTLNVNESVVDDEADESV